MCLKLYCKYFANNKYCEECNCIDCHNFLNCETERIEAFAQIAKNNPIGPNRRMSIAKGTEQGKLVAR